MTTLSTSTRRYDVDALRILAVFMLVPFHTARLFDSEPWHIKDMSAPFWTADFLIRALNVAQMSLLFLLAGMSAAWALNRRAGSQFLGERARRLLVPLLLGAFVLVAPQVWVERISPDVPLRMSPINHEGGFLSFLSTYLSCCYPEANFSWHHLWFLPYLFVYCLPLAFLARSNGAPGLARWTAAAPWRLFLFGLILILLEAATRPFFPSSHNLVWDWANHAHYLFLVLFGWWLGRNPRLEDAIYSIRRIALLSACALVVLWFASMAPSSGGFGMIDLSRATRHLARIAAEWCSLLVLIAYGRRWLTKPFPGLRILAPLALPFYIFHQTIIVLLGWLWIDWSGQPAQKAFTIGVVTVITSIALAWLCAQFALTRAATGMPATPKSPPPVEMAETKAASNKS